MDKLSDFLPLLIIIVSVIISIVQSSNKKKAERDMKNTTLPKGIPSERPLGSPVVNLPKMKSVTVDSVPEKKVEKRQALQTAFNPEIKRAVPSISVPLVSEPEMQTLDAEISDVSEFVFDAANTDELKKAVIYSEVLNRREY